MYLGLHSTYIVLAATSSSFATRTTYTHLHIYTMKYALNASTSWEIAQALRTHSIVLGPLTTVVFDELSFCLAFTRLDPTLRYPSGGQQPLADTSASSVVRNVIQKSDVQPLACTVLVSLSSKASLKYNVLATAIVLSIAFEAPSLSFCR